MAKNTNGDNINIKNKINIFLNNYFNGLVFVFFIILLIIGYFFIIRPKYAEIIAKADSATIEEETEYQKQLTYLRQLSELKKEFGEIDKRDVEKISDILPYEKNHEIIFAQMEKIVTENGYILTNLSIDAGDTGKNKGQRRSSSTEDEGGKTETSDQAGEVKKLSIRMSVKGMNYSGFKKLLSAIENNLRLMDINNLSFDPSGAGATFEITAYFLE